MIDSFVGSLSQPSRKSKVRASSTADRQALFGQKLSSGKKDGQSVLQELQQNGLLRHLKPAVRSLRVFGYHFASQAIEVYDSFETWR
jgi:hypothetical protein